MQVSERVLALDRLMEAKFVTYETLLKSQAEKVALALDAAQTAINKSEISDEKARDRLAEDMKQRFESVNEFRGQQKDVIATFMPRVEFDQYRRTSAEQYSIFRDQSTKEISELKGRLDRAEGRSGGLQGAWGIIVAVVSLAISIGILILASRQ